jgi:competence protein ComEA
MTELPFSRGQIVAALAILLVLLVLAGRFLLHAGAASSPTPPFRPVVSHPAPVATRVVVVDVVGAVRRAGLLRLADGSRVADAIAHAGGATRRADLAQVNLAAPVADGQQVVVPRRGAPMVGPAPPGGGAGPSGPVSLSTATAEQLDALPGIGPVTAQKIVDYRQEHGPFHSVAELDAIPGIGPARIDELKGLVVP